MQTLLSNHLLIKSLLLLKIFTHLLNFQIGKKSIKIISLTHFSANNFDRIFQNNY